jgi:hypothetical protein
LRVQVCLLFACDLCVENLQSLCRGCICSIVCCRRRSLGVWSIVVKVLGEVRSCCTSDEACISLGFV